jgi:hypothetical protein
MRLVPTPGRDAEAGTLPAVSKRTANTETFQELTRGFGFGRPEAPKWIDATL